MKENAEERKRRKKKGGRGESEEIKVAEERPPHSLFHLSRIWYGVDGKTLAVGRR